MKLTRSNRLVTVLVTLFSLLYMQLAVAAYACPELSPRRAAAVMVDADGVPMANCHGMDKQNPSLCHAHGEVGKQALDRAAPPVVQPFVATGFVIALADAEQPIRAGFALPTAFLMAASTAPPISILHCCFRI
jgi:hypothetical protein